MGNSAMMSSPARGQVRVLRADGKVLHFEQPVLAIEVMQENPGYLVVKYCPSSKSDGSNKGTPDESYLSTSWNFDRLKQTSLKNSVAMLRVDEELDPRGTYYLVPIKAKKEVARRWNSVFREFLKSYGKAISSFEFEHKNDSSGSEKNFTTLKRSRSVPRSRDSFRQEQQEQQRKQQHKLRPKLFPSVSFPSRLKNDDDSIVTPFMEGMGKCRELPRMPQTFHHKRHRRIRTPSLNNGWKPILESISEEVDEFSDDDSGEFHVNQSKCLRRLHSPADQLRTIANLRPMEV